MDENETMSVSIPGLAGTIEIETNATNAVTETTTAITGPELARKYNKLAESESGKALGAKPVSKFASLEVGLKRVEALESSIRAYDSGQREADAQDKAPAKPKAKPVKATKEKVVPAAKNGVYEKFNTREGTNKDKLVKFLLGKTNKSVPEDEVIKAVYGKKSAEFKIAIRGVLEGVDKATKGTGLVLKKEKGEEGLTYGLFARA